MRKTCILQTILRMGGETGTSLLFAYSNSPRLIKCHSMISLFSYFIHPRPPPFPPFFLVFMSFFPF